MKIKIQEIESKLESIIEGETDQKESGEEVSINLDHHVAVVTTIGGLRGQPHTWPSTV